MKPTLGQIFALNLLGLVVVLGVLFYIVFAGLRDTLLESSERVRARASAQISEQVSNFLYEAPRSVALFQRGLQEGLVDSHSAVSIQRALFALLMSDSDVGELTLTYGDPLGYNDKGNIQLAPGTRGQVSAIRWFGQGGEDRLWSRVVHEEGGKFVADRYLLGKGPDLAALPAQREAGEGLPDPTTHLTFVTPARKDFSGQLLWSDLHPSQLDSDLPEAQRRVEVSVQQVVTDAAGKFAGVLRVGLLAAQLDQAVRIKMAPDGVADLHCIFICDREGRLITRLRADEQLVDDEGDLRVAPASQPPEVKSALALPALRDVSARTPVVSSHFSSGGVDYLTTFRDLPGTRDWIVGIIVPRSFYLGKLIAMSDRVLGIALGAMLLLVVSQTLILRSVKRAQAQITRESLRMNAFEFSPAPTGSSFRDISAVLDSLEKAKTAMRTMGKYVPIDLGKRLYQERSEPVLGGEPMEISIMFSDVQDFTTLSEQLAPHQLADALGRYLEVLTRIIQQETQGTIDKFIGDSIMAIWNAPEAVADHARMACLAALRCRDAGRALAQRPEWRGLPEFVTRFGLHRATALVGHFGAPDRMNYTAIGDAINLASRLEGLNKQYGTAIIASEQIAAQTKEHFDFRLLDFVAVKGKSEAITIYELLGEKSGRGEMVRAYEEAFAAYVARDFEKALARLEGSAADPPSAVLRERCRGFLAAPPPADWRGVYIATSK